MSNPFSSKAEKQTDENKRHSTLVIAAVSAVLLAVAILVFFAAGGRLTSSAPKVTEEVPDVVATGQTTEVTVQVQGMSFTPSVIEVPVGNQLVVTLENTGDQRHDLLFANGERTDAIPVGESQTIDVGVISHDMEGWCTLPGHRQMGMTLEVIAVGAQQTPQSQDELTKDESTEDDLDAGHAGHDQPAGPVAIPSMDELIATAAAASPHPAELGPLSNETVHEVTFVITEDEQLLAEGVVRPLWTFEGTSPGPTLHGRVGDTFRVTLDNQGSMGHSIDFHAGVVGPDEPMRTIEPGQQLVYEFEAPRSGIWMYHCSTMPMSLHIANGMFGAVIIEPENLPEVDHSYVLIQSGIYLNDNPSAGATDPELLAFNGFPFQYVAHPLEAKVGERVRMWVLDVGPNAALSFHVVGTQFDTVWSEGTYSVKDNVPAYGGSGEPTGAQVLPLLAAQGGFVEFEPIDPGTYTFVNHIMSLAEKGAMGQLLVTE